MTYAANTSVPIGRSRDEIEATAIKYGADQVALVIKAKFEAVESGIVTFEQEFAMHMVMADGRTVSDHLVPQLDSALASGQLQIEMRRRDRP